MVRPTENHRANIIAKDDAVVLCLGPTGVGKTLMVSAWLRAITSGHQLTTCRSEH